MRLGLSNMLADFVKPGGGRVSFSSCGGRKAVYPSKVSMYTSNFWTECCILTVVPNILGGLYVSEPVGLGGQEEALGDDMG